MKWPKVVRTTHDSIVKAEVTRTIFTIPILLVTKIVLETTGGSGFFGMPCRISVETYVSGNNYS